jgi:cytochrome b
VPRQLSVGGKALSGDGALKRVWDLPTRLFHWTLVALIAFSWWSAEEHHTEWHSWSGFAILTLLLFRLLWGIFGSSTARFANFVRGPRSIISYLHGEWRGIGHSPLGALSVVALLAAIALQVGLGLFATDDDGIVGGPLSHLISVDLSEQITDLHEDFFNILLVVIGLHIAAVIFYRLVRGKRLIGPMITGRAAVDPGTAPMRPGKWWVALICLAAALAVTRWVVGGAPPFGT